MPEALAMPMAEAKVRNAGVGAVRSQAGAGEPGRITGQYLGRHAVEKSRSAPHLVTGFLKK